ncbi:hypothetical protein AXG93_2255s1160 [Marchantia polymorpha subsp. ruderalis]|uniref:Uncharacterized protein n=1 Tax=Marchantia polymorpha subsp. ruderalis TaxID=1480154 RepID=A0A176W7B3_MARPO|nr:hypothetical protein AXG93_2255s1160 [Marchantia polymorpha subsp. ruderalis]
MPEANLGPKLGRSHFGCEGPLPASSPYPHEAPDCEKKKVVCGGSGSAAGWPRSQPRRQHPQAPCSYAGWREGGMAGGLAVPQFGSRDIVWACVLATPQAQPQPRQRENACAGLPPALRNCIARRGPGTGLGLTGGLTGLGAGAVQRDREGNSKRPPAGAGERRGLSQWLA